MGKKRRRKARTERVKRKKREDSERLAADFRSTMSTDKTYEGVISYVDLGDPLKPRGSVRIEGSPLMGFFSIPADTLCRVGQTVLLRVMPKAASFPGSTALRLEFVFHTAGRYCFFQSKYFE
jgi:hypothetical protein